MNRRTPDNKNITAYLLRDLPETDMEYFDELSFTDDDFGDALKATEKNLIDDFVRGELSGEMLEKFHSYYLASPLRREKVKFAETLQTFAGQYTGATPVKTAAEESASESKINGFFSILNIFTKLNPFIRFGIAAAALAFLVLGGLWIMTSRLSKQNNEAHMKKETPTAAPNNQVLPELPPTAPLENTNPEKEIAATNTENKSSQNEKEVAEKKFPVVKSSPTPDLPQFIKPLIATFTLVPPLRDSGQIPIFSISQQTNLVAVNLQLEADDYPAYRVGLVNQSNKTLWLSANIKTKTKGENKSLNVRFSARLLQSNIYSLEVSGILANGTAEIISNYPFRAVVK